MTTRPWQELVTELVSTGLTAQQLTLLLSLVSAMSTGQSGGSPMGSSDGASAAQREKWRNQKQKQRDRDKEMSAQMSTGLSAGQADNAPLSILSSSEFVLQKEGNREEGLLPTLVEGQKVQKTKVSRGTRLPDDWAPSEKDHTFARAHLTDADTEVEATKFRNYWTNRTDRQASKPRWDRAWQNWILNARGNGNGHRGPRALQDDRLSVSKAADRLIEQAERGEFSFGPKPSLMPPSSEDDRRLLPKG